MFVVQTKDRQIASDMGRQITELTDFEAWFHADDREPGYRLQEDTQPIRINEIPVGSIEWTEKVSGKSLLPANLPVPFRCPPFASRPVWDGDRAELAKKLESGPLFVKSATKVKGFPPLVAKKIEDVPDDTLYFFSTVVNPVAEWRAFIYKGQIIDVRRYIGSWDEDLNREEIQAFKSQVAAANLPYTACTIDFARISGSSQPEWIEIHNFICVGLYGFDDIRILNMAKTAWREFSKEHKNSP